MIFEGFYPGPYVEKQTKTENLFTFSFLAKVWVHLSPSIIYYNLFPPFLNKIFPIIKETLVSEKKLKEKNRITFHKIHKLEKDKLTYLCYYDTGNLMKIY